MEIKLLQIFNHALTITGFVFVMMLVIEYINVQTRGSWQYKLSETKLRNYFFSAVLGAIPGCLGAFTVTALYSHRIVSFGAIVTTMIATSGDETFVMFAMFPESALLLTVLILSIGIIAGYFVDKIGYFKRLSQSFNETTLPLHEEERCECFNRQLIVTELIKPTSYRISLFILVAVLLVLIGAGVLAGKAEPWMRITILLVVLFSLFIVLTVPNHFLKEHLWDHIVKVHIIRIFLWTFGTLLVMHFIMNYIDVNAVISENMVLVLIAAVLLGIIPESGPHLIFVTLFSQGSIPFSILLASSISQDGHGMLPLLAESKRSFIAIKIVNIAVALLIGLLFILIGF
jgi:hypothetical protein